MGKCISILGSTGSIGTQALEVAKAHDMRIHALAANRNIDLLERQTRELRPKKVCIYDETKYHELKERLSDLAVQVLCGMDGLCEIAADTAADMLLNSVVGMVGLLPTLTAISAGLDIALANKETLVAGGSLVMDQAAKKGVAIYPVDSEHSAIFQCLQGNRRDQLRKIILTASGGPFFGKTRDELEHVTVADALNHPNWSMGSKITVDSSTLMNKGLEFIEAKWLFDLTPEQIEVVVHRQSVVHSAVEYQDYSIIAQMGVPDMKIPIQYALLYPDRMPCPTRPLSLTEYGTLTFEKPDLETFTCLQTAITAITRGGTAPCIVNGANEEAVAAFLKGKIGFLEIGALAQRAMDTIPQTEITCYEDVMRADARAREFVRNSISQ
ncbi:MAG: 1-deoxy-D-xylulose-5-phosphate reductoisomerase [Ruminococcus sp.]